MFAASLPLCRTVFRIFALLGQQPLYAHLILGRLKMLDTSDESRQLCHRFKHYPNVRRHGFVDFEAAQRLLADAASRPIDVDATLAQQVTAPGEIIARFASDARIVFEQVESSEATVAARAERAGLRGCARGH